MGWLFFFLFIGVVVVLFLAWVNVEYYRELKRMTPDEYRMFKDEESRDMQNW
jgi:hypothetical protein